MRLNVINRVNFIRGMPIQAVIQAKAEIEIWTFISNGTSRLHRMT